MLFEQQQLHQQIQEAAAAAAAAVNKDKTVGLKTIETIGSSLHSSVSLTENEEEGREELLPKLLAGLTIEKVNQMMTVRKGKVQIFFFFF